jgi:hypothetical protein
MVEIMGSVRTTLTRSNGSRSRLQDIEVPAIGPIIKYLTAAKLQVETEQQKLAWAKDIIKLWGLAEDMLTQLRGSGDINDGPS